ncbi:MAG: polysaccharide deacetylase family protein [Pseudomonadota bacterium]
MLRELLLTIDDSPSSETENLTDFLAERGISAILFCRGDKLAENPESVINAVRKGFVIGNHAYSHTRFNTLTFEEGVREIEKTEKLIDQAYRKAKVTRPSKLFRFPYMDRGCGGRIVDYDAAPEHRETLLRLFDDVVSVDLSPSSDDMKLKKRKWQEWLKQNGFTPPLPSAGITHPWYAQTEMASAIDCMFTYSMSEWMLTARHVGKWPYKTPDDLKRKIDDDPWLKDGTGTGIVVAHDQETLFPLVSSLVTHMLHKGFTFSGNGVR